MKGWVWPEANLDVSLFLSLICEQECMRQELQESLGFAAILIDCRSILVTCLGVVHQAVQFRPRLLLLFRRRRLSVV